MRPGSAPFGEILIEEKRFSGSKYPSGSEDLTESRAG